MHLQDKSSHHNPRALRSLKTDLERLFSVSRAFTPLLDASSLLASAPRKALLKAVAPFVRWRDGAVTRHVIFASSGFNLVLATWAPGATMTLHDAPDEADGVHDCLLRVLKGSLRETTTSSDMLVSDESIIDLGGVSYVDHVRGGLHKLEAEAGAITLHMYSPGLDAPDLAY